MQIKSKRGRVLELPTPEEDAQIQAGIDADPDTYEMTDAEFKKARPRGRPKADVTKEQISLRLSRDVLDRFRETGAGWQTRIDEALKEWVREHQ